MNNNEIEQTIIYYTNMGAYNNLEMNKRINYLICNLKNKLHEYQNILGYVNNTLKSNYYFYSINDFQGFVQKTINELPEVDSRRQNLESAIYPINALNDDYRKIASELQTITASNVKSNMQNNNRPNSSEGDLIYKIIYGLGIFMVLVGISLFGKYVLIDYLSDMAKAIVLYAVGIIILLIGMLVIKKRNVSFSRGIVVLATCELYISTLISIFSLEIIDGYIGLGITFIISICIALYSYFEKSAFIRYSALTLGLLCVLCSFDNMKSDIDAKSIVIVCYIIIINIVNLLLPIKQNKKVISNFIIYLTIINDVIFTIEAFFITKYCVCILGAFYILAALFINKFIKKDDNHNFSDFNVLYVACISMLFTSNYIFCGIMIAISIVTILLCKNNLRKSSMVAIMIFVFKMIFMFNFEDNHVEVTVIYACIAAMLIIISMLNSSNKGIFYSACIHVGFLVLVLWQASSMFDNWYINYSVQTVLYLICQSAIVILCSFICQIILRKYDEVYTVIKYYGMISIIPFSNYVGAIINQNTEFKYFGAITAPILYLIIMLIYSNVNFLRNKSYKVDNAIIVFGLYAYSLLFYFKNSNIYLIIASLLIFVIACIFVNDKYNNVFKSVAAKISFINILAITYFLSLLRANFDSIANFILIDILFMILACIDVYIGFKKRIKGVRVFGIVISFFVCFKVILMDNYRMDFIEKTILFITVGILAIVFAYIYSYLGKRLDIIQKNSDTSNMQMNGANYNNMNYNNGNGYNNQNMNYNNGNGYNNQNMNYNNGNGYNNQNMNYNNGNRYNNQNMNYNNGNGYNNQNMNYQNKNRNMNNSNIRNNNASNNN